MVKNVQILKKIMAKQSRLNVKFLYHLILTRKTGVIFDADEMDFWFVIGSNAIGSSVSKL